MATILLNEADPMRHKQLRTQLQRQGHNVWSASHLNDIVSTLHDVAVDLMILDLDNHRLDDLAAFADRWRGVKILFQASYFDPRQDFRSWMADHFVSKSNHDETVVQTVDELLMAA